MQKHLYIKNRKGLRLAAIIQRPSKVGIFPFVILLHGFKGYKEEKTYSELEKELAKHGIGSIRFDASGFGESDGTLEDNYRFSNHICDVEDVNKYILNLKCVDKKRIGICGQSMGGMQAIVFASKHPKLKALCIISSPDKMATTDRLSKVLKKWEKNGYLKETSSKYEPIKIPYSFIEDAMKWNMLDYIKSIRTPLLVIIGKDDKVVLPNQTRKIYKLANQPKRILELEGMDHFYKNNSQILKKVNLLITDFFINNL